MGKRYDKLIDFILGVIDLGKFLLATTLGSPWWVDTFILRKPVKKILKIALLGACAANFISK
jgi:hypothetical protein